MTRSYRRQSNSVVLHPMWVDGDNHSKFSLFIHTNTFYLSVEVEHLPLRNLRATLYQKYSNFHSSIRYESILFHMRWDKGRSQDFHILDEWSGLGESNNSVGLREMNNFHFSPISSLYGKRLTLSDILEAPAYECHVRNFLLSWAIQSPLLLSLWYLEQSRSVNSPRFALVVYLSCALFGYTDCHLGIIFF